MSKLLLLVIALVGLAGCPKDPKPHVSTSSGDAGPGKPLFGPSTPDANPADVTGAMLYGKLCVQCHGPEAKGGAADNAPSLRSETFLATATDKFLAESIAIGRPGTSMAMYGKAYNGPLDDAAIAKIIAFLREGGPAPVALEPKPSKGDAAKGQVTWDKVCKVCHGAPGTRGITNDLSNPAFLASASDEFIRYAIVHGRPGTLMLPMGGAQLTEAEIEDVVALIRSWQTALPVLPGEQAKPPRPKDMQIVLNPKGKKPKFTVKDERFVPAKEIAEALKKGQRMVIVDARPGSEWVANRITGAISIPYHELDLIDDLPDELKQDWLLAYCACPHHLSGEVVDALRKRGFEKAMVIDEGINYWKREGYPTEGTGGDPHAGHDHGHHHGHGHSSPAPEAEKMSSP